MTRLRLKRHYRLLLLLALVIAGLIAGLGDQPIVAYGVADARQVADTVIVYGYTLAALVDALPESIQIPGISQGAGAAVSQ